MDADGSHLPEQLPRLLDALPGADVVLGSRWVSGGRVVNWPRRRELLSRGGNTYARLDARHPAARRDRWLPRVPSGDAGEARPRRRRLRRATASRSTWPGARSRPASSSTEVPITFVERVHGESKMDGAIVREALVKVTEWGVRHRLNQAPPARRRLEARV